MSRPARRIGGDLLNLPLYPFLVGALPAVHFYEVNYRQIQGGDLIRPILLACILVILVLVVGRLVWRSFGASAVVLTPLLTVIFKGNDLGPWLSLGFLALSVGLGIVLKRQRIGWPQKLGLPLNLALIVLLVLPLVSARRASNQENTPRPSAFFKSEVLLPAGSWRQPRPDIYYLLVDGLGQPTFVESRYPITKAEYSDLFANRGFQVMHHSFANYPQTALSTAATLNLGQIDHVLDIHDPHSRDRRVLMEVVGNSRAVRALHRLGYQVVDFPSGYPLTRQTRADRKRTPLLDPTFVEYFLLEDGILPLLLPLLGQGPADVSFALRRGRLNYIFDQLPAAREGIPDSDPVFVYAHILAPHPPFVFGAEGQALASRAEFTFADGNHWRNIHGRQDKSYRTRYADQAKWVMKRLAATVDEIIASSSRQKIIIIQGDHGPGSGLEWEKPLESDHYERFGIFNAWYVSDGRSLPLYDGITSMNTFPLIFNFFFGANLPQLQDEYWFARMSQPYTFIPVEK